MSMSGESVNQHLAGQPLGEEIGGALVPQEQGLPEASHQWLVVATGERPQFADSIPAAEPWWDRFWVREPQSVQWLRIQGTWVDFRVRQSRRVVRHKTLWHHHPWLPLLQQSPKLLSAQHSRAHWLGTKPNTPANKARPLDIKPNKHSTWEPQLFITLKH